MKFLIWLGAWVAGAFLIWGVALATELIIEACLHLTAGLTITTVHGHRNFLAIILASVVTLAYGFLSAMYVGSEVKL